MLSYLETSDTSNTSEHCGDVTRCFSHRFYSRDAAHTNGGYRSASLCIELRSDSDGPGFLLPAEQVGSVLGILT